MPAPRLRAHRLHVCARRAACLWWRSSPATATAWRSATRSPSAWASPTRARSRAPAPPTTSPRPARSASPVTRKSRCGTVLHETGPRQLPTGMSELPGLKPRCTGVRCNARTAPGQGAWCKKAASLLHKRACCRTVRSSTHGPPVPSGWAFVLFGVVRWDPRDQSKLDGRPNARHASPEFG